MSQAAKEISRTALPPAGTYDLDVTHSTVEFVARHLVSRVRGRFTDFNGQIVVRDTLEGSSVSVEIDAASIQTNTEKRDEHLKSGDFLELETYPTLSFTSTAVRALGGGGFELDGNLTIKDVTRPVTLTGEFLGFGNGVQGDIVLGASARTTIDREDYGMTWNMAAEAGGVMVGKKIGIEIEVEAHKTS